MTFLPRQRNRRNVSALLCREAEEAKRKIELKLCESKTDYQLPLGSPSASPKQGPDLQIERNRLEKGTQYRYLATTLQLPTVN
jgi:hypothetical protein